MSLESSSSDKENASFAWDVSDQKIVQKYVSVPSSVIETIPANFFAAIDSEIQETLLPKGDFTLKVDVQLHQPGAVEDVIRNFRSIIAQLKRYGVGFYCGVSCERYEVDFRRIEKQEKEGPGR